MDIIKRNISIILVFILTLSVRIFWICQKDYVFVDEPISFSIISPNTIHNDHPFKTFECAEFKFEQNHEYTTKEIRKLLFNNRGDIKSLFTDLKSLYLHHYDGGHTNLYYILLRIWANNLDNVGINTIIFYGCTFNLLLFTISFFIMFKLLQLIIKDKKYISAALFLFFINSASVSSTIFTRDYQLQTLGMILATYIFCKLYIWINDNNNKNLKILNPKNIILYSLAFAFYFLTGYYSVIYALLLLFALLVTIFKRIKLDKYDMIKLISIILVSIILVFVVDRNYLNMSQSFVKAANDTFMTLSIFERELFTAFDMLQKTLFYPVLLIFIILLFIFSKENNKKQAPKILLIIFSLAFVWSLTVLLITPFNDIRYFIPAAPLLCFGYIYILKSFDYKYTVIFCLISFILILIPNVRFNNFDTVRPFLFYVHDRDNFTFRNVEKIPVVFKDYKLTMPNIVLNTDDTQKIVFTDKIPDKNFMYKLYILFFFKDNLDEYKTQIYKNNVIDLKCTRFNDCYAIIDNN